VVKSADLVVANDGDKKALELLAQNVSSKLRQPSLAKLIMKRLEWENREHIEALELLALMLHTFLMLFCFCLPLRRN
jgi:methyltransferase-like protein 6